MTPESSRPTVRKANPDDLPTLFKRYHQLSQRNQPDLTPEHLTAWDAVERQPGLHLLVTELDGPLVGPLTLSLLPNFSRGARPYGVIENVVTDAAAQGSEASRGDCQGCWGR